MFSSVSFTKHTVLQPVPQSRFRAILFTVPQFPCNHFLDHIPPPTCNAWQHWSVSCPYSFTSPECHIDSIIHYVAFWVWLLSLSIIQLRCIHAIACVSSWLFYCWMIFDFVNEPDCFAIHQMGEILAVSRFW